MVSSASKLGRTISTVLYGPKRDPLKVSARERTKQRLKLVASPFRKALSALKK